MADDEEVPDQKAMHDERCAKTTECAMLYVQYEACAKRIEAKGHGECTGAPRLAHATRGQPTAFLRPPRRARDASC